MNYYKIADSKAATCIEQWAKLCTYIIHIYSRVKLNSLPTRNTALSTSPNLVPTTTIWHRCCYSCLTDFKNLKLSEWVTYTNSQSSTRNWIRLGFKQKFYVTLKSMLIKPLWIWYNTQKVVWKSDICKINLNRNTTRGIYYLKGTCNQFQVVYLKKNKQYFFWKRPFMYLFVINMTVLS